MGKENIFHNLKGVSKSLEFEKYINLVSGLVLDKNISYPFAKHSTKPKM